MVLILMALVESSGGSWRAFSEEEVKYALNSMEDDKALGADGFPLMFLKVCWDVVGKGVMAVFKAFHSKE